MPSKAVRELAKIKKPCLYRTKHACATARMRKALFSRPRTRSQPLVLISSTTIATAILMTMLLLVSSRVASASSFVAPTRIRAYSAAKRPIAVTGIRRKACLAHHDRPWDMRAQTSTGVRMSSSTSSVSPSSSRYPMLYNKNLVSIDDCIEAAAVATEDGRVVFVDGSWYHRGDPPRNGRTEFEKGLRIKGAKYMDMDDVAASKDLFPELNPKGLPHMLPPKNLFAAAMDSMGISNENHVVVYGKEGCVFTPRTWFLFRSMGHNPSKVHLMQGSLEEYIEAGGEYEENPVEVIKAKDLDLDTPPKYQAKDPSNVCDMASINAVVDGTDNAIIVDPRGTTFHNGHMPNAINVPYSSLVRDDNWLQLKSIPELHQVFKEAGVDVHAEKPIICSCGSGVSVCHVFLALEECGRDMTKTVIYDGSWAEYGSDPDTIKVADK